MKNTGIITIVGLVGALMIGVAAVIIIGNRSNNSPITNTVNVIVESTSQSTGTRIGTTTNPINTESTAQANEARMAATVAALTQPTINAINAESTVQARVIAIVIAAKAQSDADVKSAATVQSLQAESTAQARTNATVQAASADATRTAGNLAKLEPTPIPKQLLVKDGVASSQFSDYSARLATGYIDKDEKPVCQGSNGCTYAWISAANDSIGSWIEVILTQPQKIAYITINGCVGNVEEMSIRFSDGSSQKIKLKVLDSCNTTQLIELKPVITSNLRFTTEKVRETGKSVSIRGISIYGW